MAKPSLDYKSRDGVVQWFGRQLTKYMSWASLASFSGSDSDLRGPPLATHCILSMFATTNIFPFHILVHRGLKSPRHIFC